MSTATAEKPSKPAPAPMGSFLGKLAPPPKPKEKADEPGKSATPPVVADAVAPAPDKAAPEKADAKEAAGEGKADAVSEEKPSGEAQNAEQLEKRLKDTQTWANEEHKRALKAERQVKELLDRMDRMEKKIDGTYEPPQAPSAEQLTYDAEMRGKLRASHRAAVRKYGEEFVMANVWVPDSPYQKLQEANPLVAQRVLASDDPVQEALDLLKEEEDAKKYGRTSEEMKKKIEEELKPKLMKEVLDSLKTKPGPATATLGNVRGESDRGMQNEAPQKLDLGAVFPHGRART